MRSDAPLADQFQDWVTDEVLPTLRRTGSYGTPAVPDMSTPQGRLAILDLAMRAEKRALEAETRIAELEPDAARAQRTMDAEGLALVGTVAKRFGMQPSKLFNFLRAEKFLISGGTRKNEPYAHYIQSGHFEVKVGFHNRNPDLPPQEHSTPMVTPKGEALIWKRLFAAGLVSSPTMPPPLPEQLQLSA
jgi:phage antirepressor YoqD-like protein